MIKEWPVTRWLSSLFEKPVKRERRYKYNGHLDLLQIITDMQARYRKPVFAFNAYFAGELECNPRTIQRYLRRLQEEEKIIITGEGRRRKISAIIIQQQKSIIKRKPRQSKCREIVAELSQNCRQNVTPIYRSYDPMISLSNYCKEPDVEPETPEPLTEEARVTLKAYGIL